MSFMPESDPAAAHFQRGINIYDGRQVVQDHAEAIKCFHSAADLGHDGAMCNLGFMYEHGQGCKPNPGEAFKWYLKSAEQGNRVAQFNLGAIYASGGMGRLRDFIMARRWYEKAGNQGHPGAQLRLGLLLLDGIGGPQDEAEAVVHIRKSADNHYSPAELVLGALYFIGRGVDQNLEQAVDLYHQSALSNKKPELGYRFQLYTRPPDTQPDTGGVIDEDDVQRHASLF